MFRMEKYKYLFVVSDFLILTVALLASILLFQHKISVSGEILNFNIGFILLIIGLTFSFLFVFGANNLYKINIIITRSAHLAALLKSFWYSLPIIIIAALITPRVSPYVLFVYIFSFVFSAILLLYIFRIEILRGLYLNVNSNKFRRNIIIVGDGKSGRLLAAKLVFENPIGINIVGFIDDSKEIGEEIINGKKVLGKSINIKELAQRKKVDEILIAEETDDYNRIINLIELCQESKIDVKISSNLFGIVSQKIYTEKYANLPVIDVSPKYKNNANIRFKRVFDFVLSSVGLFLLSPFLMLIAAIIKLTSPGPVLFKQTRIGKNGKPFTFFKFRSMYVADEDDKERKQNMLKFMKGDIQLGENKKIISRNRVTWIGQIIRKTSVDELPQLINVIRGEMSLVGPRPCLSYEYEGYDSWQKKKFKVLPGCTGVWQVLGRSSVSFNDSIILDLYYINNMSPWLDLQLIIKTVPVMLFARGGE